MPSTYLRFALVGALSLALPKLAAAQSPAELADAKRWFQEGVEAEKAGDCETAVDRFEKALTVKETPQILLRVGRCHASLGHLVKARESIVRARDLAATVGGDVLNVAQSKLSDIDPRVPRLTISSSSTYDGLSVTVDGTEFTEEETRAPLLVDPGEHTVVARAPGHRVLEKTVSVAEGEKVTLEVALTEEVSGPAPSPPPDAPSDEEGLDPIPIVLVAGGSAFVLGGVVMLVVAQSKSSQIDEDCGGDRDTCQLTDPADQARVTDDTTTVNVLRGVSVGLGLIGLAAVGTGIVLLLTNEPAGADTAQAPTLRVMPSVSPGHAGVDAWIRF